METKKIFCQILSVMFFPGFLSRTRECTRYSFTDSVDHPHSEFNKIFQAACPNHEYQDAYPLPNFRMAINLTPNFPLLFFDDLGASGWNDKDVSHNCHHDGNHDLSQRLGSGGGLESAGGNAGSLRARTDLTYNLVIVPGSDLAYVGHADLWQWINGVELNLYAN